MNINTDIYGVESTWFPMVQESTVENAISQSAMLYIANFGGDTLQSRLSKAYYTGRLQFNSPIDNSIATVGVDDNCILLNQSYINVPDFDLENQQEYTEFDILCSMNKNGTNALCFFKDRSVIRDIGYSLTQTNYNKYYSGYQQTLQPETNTSTTYYNVSPVTKVPVKDLVWCVIVKCSNSNPLNERISTGLTTDLYSYCFADYTINNVTKKYYEWYPIIIYVAIVPYFRTNKVINDSDPITTVYRRTDSNALTYYPAMMNGYNQISDPYTDDDSPLQILTYYQPQTTTDRENSLTYNNFYTGTVTSTTTYGIQCGVAMFCGTRNGTYTYNASSKYQYVGVDKLKCRIWLDERIIKSNIWTDIETFGGIENFYEYWLKQIAYLGGFFTDSVDIAVHAKEWNIPHSFIGTIDDNGVTHGYYTEGTENENQKQYNWQDFTENNFNPDNSRPNGEDKEVPSDPYNFNRTYFGFQTGNYYALTESDLNLLNGLILQQIRTEIL